ncbi:MAG: LppX_LprAFG lipoprotein [Dehalococcoidia bacterium]|jgi:hypothetical protein|nr:LppX_LprAFG lipoprotein [Dehalococcoidia bacterium]
MNTVRSGLPARQISTISLLLVIAIIIAVVAGCSNKPDEPESTPAPPIITAAEAVVRSRDAMANLSSFKFELTHDSGSTALSGGLELSQAGGTVLQDGLDLEAEATIGRAFVRIEAVVIDNRTWMTNPLTGTWAEIPPEDSPFSFLDPVKLVADILGETQDASYPEDRPPSGVSTVEGRIPATTLAALVGIVDPDAIPDVTLTLDADSYLLKKIVIRGVAQAEDDASTTRVITLSGFDDPVVLEPPI